MNDADLQPRVEAGRAAQRLLESPDYQTAVADAQGRIMREWAQTQPREIEAREALYFEIRALQQVDHSLRLRTEDGQLAAGLLAKLRRAFQRA